MKIRKTISRQRRYPIIFLLLLGLSAPLGCANGPKDKNLFAKVWGPDRVTFKEAVGLGDSPRTKKNDSRLVAGKSKKADPKRRSSATGDSTKLARTEKKTLREKFGQFGNVLFAAFRNPEDEEKATRNPSGNQLKSKALAANVRRQARTNSKSQNKKPAGSLYASGKTGGNKNDSAESFSEFLKQQNKTIPSGKENSLAQSDDSLRRKAADHRNNQFVTEFDSSWDQLKRNQQEEDDDLDEWDDDDLDEQDEKNPFEGLASSKAEEELPSLDETPDWARDSSSPRQQESIARMTESKKRVNRLLSHATSELEAGRIDQALAIVRYAEDLAAREGVTYSASEDSPAQLAQIIQDKIDNKIPSLDELPQDNAFVFSDEAPIPEHDFRPRENHSVSEQHNQYPFSDSEPSYQDSPLPDYNVANTQAYPRETEDLPTIEPLPPTGSSHYQKFESDNSARMDEFPTPRQEQEFIPDEEYVYSSPADIQTEIVEVSDPYGGMIVDSETVPNRIPSGQNGSAMIRQTAIEGSSGSSVQSADGRSTKYRYPKVPFQSISDRHKAWAPISTKKTNRTPKEETSKSKANSHWAPAKSNRRSSINTNRKKVNSNRGARIITSDNGSTPGLDNTWLPAGSKRSNQLTKVESADLNVVQTEAPRPLETKNSQSEEITVVNHEQFFQMGGQSGTKPQTALALGSWDNDGNNANLESGVGAAGQISLIIFCIVAAVVIGVALRRRESLLLLLQKFSHR